MPLSALMIYWLSTLVASNARRILVHDVEQGKMYGIG